MTNFIPIKWNTSRVAVNNCEEVIFVFDIFMIFEQFYLDFYLNSCGVFCVYGFSFRDFGFCILGCTVCLATSSVIRWFESTRQPIEVRPNSLLINIFSVLSFMFRLLSFGYWMDLLLLFPVRLPFVSINLHINLASEFLPRNYSLTSASHSILRGTFMNIKLLSWLKQGYICNIFAEICTITPPLQSM